MPLQFNKLTVICALALIASIKTMNAYCAHIGEAKYCLTMSEAPLASGGLRRVVNTCSEKVHFSFCYYGNGVDNIIRCEDQKFAGWEVSGNGSTAVEGPGKSGSGASPLIAACFAPSIPTKPHYYWIQHQSRLSAEITHHIFVFDFSSLHAVVQTILSVVIILQVCFHKLEVNFDRWKCDQDRHFF